MKITDKEVLRQLKIVRSSELRENIETLPEDEVDGRSDMQVLKDELEYLLSMYDEGGTYQSDDLEQAREFIRETKNGKQFKLDINDPVRSIKKSKIRFEQAKNTVNEYNRLKSLEKRIGGK